jgi:hypothetical protein
VSVTILPFTTFMRRYRVWRDAFLGRPRPSQSGPARVRGIDYLKWKRYGEWRRKQMALKQQ